MWYDDPEIACFSPVTSTVSEQVGNALLRALGASSNTVDPGVSTLQEIVDRALLIYRDLLEGNHQPSMRVLNRYDKE